MDLSDLPTLVMNCSLLLASILMGLYGVLLLQYEQTKTQITEKRAAYVVLLVITTILIFVGFLNAMLAFTVALGMPILGATICFTRQLMLVLFWFELASPVAAIVLFSVLYVIL